MLCLAFIIEILQSDTIYYSWFSKHKLYPRSWFLLGMESITTLSLVKYLIHYRLGR